MIKAKNQVLRIGASVFVLLSCSVLPGAAADSFLESAQRQEGGATMKIRLMVEGKEVIAVLDDNATSRDFLSLLPLTLTLKDHHQTEKVGYPPRRLSIEGAPAGVDPEVGDVAYYAPWGNLALYYRDFGDSPGLVRLGRIESGLEALKQPGELKTTIERVE